MNTIESNWKIMAHIHSYCTQLTQKKFNCVSLKWRKAGEFATAKNDILNKMLTVNQLFNFQHTIDLFKCESYEGLESCLKQYHIFLKKSLSQGNQIHADIPLIWLKEFPKKLEAGSSEASMKPVSTHPLVAPLVQLIQNQRYQNVLDILEPALDKQNENMYDVLSAIIKAISEEHALRLLNTANLGLIHLDYTNSTLFRIIKKGNPAGYNFFHPFLTSHNKQIQARTNLLLDRIGYKIKRMKPGSAMDDCMVPYFKILNSLEKFKLCYELTMGNNSPEPNPPSTENQELHNDRKKDSVKLMRSKPAIDNTGEMYPKNDPNVNNKSSLLTNWNVETINSTPFGDSIKGSSLPSNIARTNIKGISNLITDTPNTFDFLSNQDSEETLNIAISLLPIDPLESFNYLILNGSHRFNRHYLKNVFDTLKNAVQRIGNINFTQKELAIRQLMEWITQYKSFDFAVDWRNEVLLLENTPSIEVDKTKKGNSSGGSIVEQNIEKVLEAIKRTMYLQQFDPSQAFNQMMQYAGDNYWVNVYTALKSSVLKISDPVTKQKALQELLHWLEKGKANPEIQNWYAEVSILIADASLPLCSVLIPNNLNSTALISASSSASSSSSSPLSSSTSSSTSSYPKNSASLDVLIEQILSAPKQAYEQIERLYNKMLAEGRLTEGLNLIDMNIGNPHLKDIILAQLIEHHMTSKARNLNYFNQICAHISDPALIYELGHKFRVFNS